MTGPPDPPVDPGQLCAYLEHAGWRREGFWHGAGVWRQLGHRLRLLVPSPLEYPDDGELITEAVRQLAAWEHRTVPDLTRDIATHATGRNQPS